MSRLYPKDPLLSRTLSIILIGNAPDQRSTLMIPYNLFKHADGRSSNYYCVFKNPITEKSETFSCRSEDVEAAHVFVSQHLPERINQIYRRQYERSNPVEKSEAVNVPQPTLLSEYRAQFVEQYRTKRGQPLRLRSRKAYNDAFNQLIKRYGDLYVHGLTVEQARAFILSGQPSDRTAQKHCTNLRAAFSYAVQQGLIETNPFDSFRPPLPSYTDEEIAERLFDSKVFKVFYLNLDRQTYGGRRLANMLLLIHETGLRLGEARHVKSNWIDFEKRLLKVQSDSDFLVKTNSSSRIIPLSKNALVAIEAQLQDNRVQNRSENLNSNFLFPSPTGGPLSESTIHNLFRRERSRILGDMSVHIHGLRHAFVTRLSESGMPDRQIQVITGHSTLEMVRRYSHLKERVVEPCRDILNNSAFALEDF